MTDCSKCDTMNGCACETRSVCSTPGNAIEILDADRQAWKMLAEQRQARIETLERQALADAEVTRGLRVSLERTRDSIFAACDEYTTKANDADEAHEDDEEAALSAIADLANNLQASVWNLAVDINRDLAAKGKGET